MALTVLTSGTFASALQIGWRLRQAGAGLTRFSNESETVLPEALQPVDLAGATIAWPCHRRFSSGFDQGQVVSTSVAARQQLLRAATAARRTEVLPKDRDRPVGLFFPGGHWRQGWLCLSWRRCARGQARPRPSPAAPTRCGALRQDRSDVARPEARHGRRTRLLRRLPGRRPSGHWPRPTGKGALSKRCRAG